VPCEPDNLSCSVGSGRGESARYAPGFLGQEQAMCPPGSVAGVQRGEKGGASKERLHLLAGSAMNACMRCGRPSWCCQQVIQRSLALCPTRFDPGKAFLQELEDVSHSSASCLVPIVHRTPQCLPVDIILKLFPNLCRSRGHHIWGQCLGHWLCCTRSHWCSNRSALARFFLLLWSR